MYAVGNVLHRAIEIGMNLAVSLTSTEKRKWRLDGTRHLWYASFLWRQEGKEHWQSNNIVLFFSSGDSSKNETRRARNYGESSYKISSSHCWWDGKDEAAVRKWRLFLCLGNKKIVQQNVYRGAQQALWFHACGTLLFLKEAKLVSFIVLHFVI